MELAIIATKTRQLARECSEQRRDGGGRLGGGYGGNRGNTKSFANKYNPNCFCIFYETYGYEARYCRNHDYTMDYKKRQAAKHIACIRCFKTGHKVAYCPFKKKCMITKCNEMHHPNLHARKDIKTCTKNKKTIQLRHRKIRRKIIIIPIDEILTFFPNQVHKEKRQLT